MSLGISYWIVAWCMMGVAFLTASGAILIGSRRLDAESARRQKLDSDGNKAKH